MRRNAYWTRHSWKPLSRRNNLWGQMFVQISKIIKLGRVIPRRSSAIRLLFVRVLILHYWASAGGLHDPGYVASQAYVSGASNRLLVRCKAQGLQRKLKLGHAVWAVLVSEQAGVGTCINQREQPWLHAPELYIFLWPLCPAMDNGKIADIQHLFTLKYLHLDASRSMISYYFLSRTCPQNSEMENAVRHRHAICFVKWLLLSRFFPERILQSIMVRSWGYSLLGTGPACI